MKSFQGGPREPKRWTTESSTTSAEGMAGAALRRARDATEPLEEVVARLGSRVFEAGARSRAHRRPRRLALAALLLLTTGAAMGATGVLWRRIRVTGGTPSPSTVTETTVQEGPPSRTRRQTGEPSLRGPAMLVPPAVEPPSPARPPVVPPAPSLAPVGTSRPPAAGGLARRQAAAITEAELLARAFRSLRSDQDATAALRALDRYDDAFPTGTLAVEARVARAEALIALGRRADALTVLTRPAGGRWAPARNVLLMRSELLAEAGRCEDALPDFDRILGASDSGDTGARALFGRGVCRLRDGDVAAGRRDLRRYIQLHPNGGLAAAARDELTRSLDEHRNNRPRPDKSDPEGP